MALLLVTFFKSQEKTKNKVSHPLKVHPQCLIMAASASAISFNAHTLGFAFPPSSSPSSDVQTLSLQQSATYATYFTACEESPTTTNEDEDSWSDTEAKTILTFSEAICSYINYSNSNPNSNSNSNSSLLKTIVTGLDSLGDFSTSTTPTAISAREKTYLLGDVTALQALVSSPPSPPNTSSCLPQNFSTWLIRTQNHYQSTSTPPYYSNLTDPESNPHLSAMLQSPEPEFFTPNNFEGGRNNYNSYFWGVVKRLITRGELGMAWSVITHHSRVELVNSSSGDDNDNDVENELERMSWHLLRSVLVSAPTIASRRGEEEQEEKEDQEEEGYWEEVRVHTREKNFLSKANITSTPPLSSSIASP